MATAKEIKHRIKSIKNTQKTTKAMELVAGAKMRKAIQAATASRAYRQMAWGIATRLRTGDMTEAQKEVMRFFQEPEGGAKKTTILVFTSNRGLCGAFNSNIVKQVLGYHRAHPQEEITVAGIGKKGVAMLRMFGLHATLAYEKDDTARDDSSVREVSAWAYNAFAKGQTDKVLIAFTDFHSPLVQTATLRQLYPFERPEQSAGQPAEPTGSEHMAAPLLYTYEPSPVDVLAFLVPRLGEVEVYQSLLESNASEHSARMLAMKNATEAAKEMGKELVLAYNRARQAAITKEIAEIAAGTAAVS